MCRAREAAERGPVPEMGDYSVEMRENASNWFQDVDFIHVSGQCVL